MYSYEERMKAVKLYIKYDLCAADTIRELGYPRIKSISVCKIPRLDELSVLG